MRIRVLARIPAKLVDAPWRDDVEVVRGDLTDAETLDAAFAGVDVVYHLVHAMGTAADFADAERRGAVNVAAAARRAGVGRIVYLGGLHPEGAPLSRHLTPAPRSGGSCVRPASRRSSCRPASSSERARRRSRWSAT